MPWKFHALSLHPAWYPAASAETPSTIQTTTRYMKNAAVRDEKNTTETYRVPSACLPRNSESMTPHPISADPHVDPVSQMTSRV